jgi:excisionase family DNA binding protein
MVKEVAVTLRCSPKHVRNLVADGVLEPIRLSPKGHFRFRAEDVERLISGEPKSHE